VGVYAAVPTHLLLEEIRGQADRMGAALVLIDGLMSVIAAEEINDGEEPTTALDRILELGTRRHLMLLHDRRSATELSAVLASTDRPIETVLALERLQRRLIRVRAARSPGEPVDGAACPPLDPAEEAQLGAAILAQLRAADRPLRLGELCAALGEHPRWVLRGLSELRRAGRALELADRRDPRQVLFAGCDPVEIDATRSGLVRVRPWVRLGPGFGSRDGRQPRVD
jgi:hypothetical protein